VAAGNDAGSPVAIDGTGTAADMFRSIAAHIIADIAPPTPAADLDMAGCSARLFDSDDGSFEALETPVTVGPRSS
jgi:ATP-binding protein involved in chromosome partitioning